MALVTRVGEAAGARAAAAALACAGSSAEHAALLIELDVTRPPPPSLLATTAARGLEERLAAHMPGARVASRGRICQLTLLDDHAYDGDGDGDRDGDDARVRQVAAALPLVRDSLAVVHLPPRLLQAVLAEPRLEPSGALLRADLATDRALTALAVSDLMGRSVETVVLKRPLAWMAGRAALFGALPNGAAALPRRVGRLLS